MEEISKLKEAGKHFADSATSLTKGIGEALSAIGKDISNPEGEIRTGISTGLQEAKETVTAAGKTVRDMVSESGVTQAVVELAEEARDKTKSVVQGVAADFSQRYNEHRSSGKDNPPDAQG